MRLSKNQVDTKLEIFWRSIETVENPVKQGKTKENQVKKDVFKELIRSSVELNEIKQKLGWNQRFFCIPWLADETETLENPIKLGKTPR